MIHIRYFIHDNTNNIQTKILNFDSKHEKNFETISLIIQEKFEKRLQISIDDFVTLCSHYLVKELRLKQIPTKIQQGLAKMLSINKISLRTFENVEKITMEIQVDNKPKKIVILHHPVIYIV